MIQQKTDKYGVKHKKYQQYYNSHKIEGAVFVLHSKNNKVFYANGTHYNITSVNTPKLTVDKSKKTATNYLKRQFVNVNKFKVKESKLIITGELPNRMGKHYLAYKHSIRHPNGKSYYVYVDAPHDRVINMQPASMDVQMTATTLYNGSQNITGIYNIANGIYLTKATKSYGSNSVTFQTTKPHPIYGTPTPFQHTSSNWGTTKQHATSAHFATEKTVDYWANTHQVYGYGNSTTLTTFLMNIPMGWYIINVT